MNEQTSLSAQQYIRCGKRSANALKSAAIFGGGFLLTFLVYIIVYYLINPGYAAIAAIITMLASLFSVNALAKYTLTEFEYEVFRGEFKITKIMGRTTRRNFITFSATNILHLQPYSEAALKKLSADAKKTLDASSYQHYDACWLVLVDIGLGKQVCVIIEPTEEILNLMRRHLNPDKIHDGEEHAQ